MRDYVPLTSSLLKPGISYHRPRQFLPERVTHDSPAVEVMTDLRQVTPVTVEPEASIEAANGRMIRYKVRLLLVADREGRVQGLITATDILGEKPIQVIQSRGVRREEVMVQDIMTPQERLEVLSMDEVLACKVGHVVATLRQAGRQHTLVVDRDEHGVERVRGIFSASQIARQLGIDIQTHEIARTFSEIEATLAR